MSKMGNHWEISVSRMIPYLQWSELTDGEINAWEIGRHNHASYELHIILSGQCSLSVNDTEILLKAGQGILISPKVFHAPASVQQPFRRLSASFFPDEAQLLGMIPAQGSFLLFSTDDATNSLCDTIISEAKKKTAPFHKELLANQFSLLMLQLFRAIKENTPPKESVSKPQQAEDMTIIDKFFVYTPPRLRTRKELARLLHCSERQALRKIDALYGMNFQQKQILSRIDTAQHLLRFTDKSIEEISTLAGYSDTSAFYKAFKRYTDTTPVKYRKYAGNPPIGNRTNSPPG